MLSSVTGDLWRRLVSAQVARLGISRGLYEASLSARSSSASGREINSYRQVVSRLSDHLQQTGNHLGASPDGPPVATETCQQEDCLYFPASGVSAGFFGGSRVQRCRMDPNHIRGSLHVSHKPSIVPHLQAFVTHTHISYRRGCLPPQLLKETLATYTLLFPEPGDQASRTVLEREVAKNNLDSFFLSPLFSSLSEYAVHEHPQDALDPDDVRSLYQKYPHWAERLYSLWKEAEDPTPVTMLERWSESRKNPRFTYWCTVVSLSIAIAFGFVATALGALQVWISYCAWVDDPGATFCSKEGHSGSKGGD